MKKLWLVLMLLAGSARATPYFRPGWVNPQLNGGALIDPFNSGQSLGAFMVPLINHNHNDGYLLIPGEDWSLFALGGALNSGNLAIPMGPMFNILPSFQNLGLAILGNMKPSPIVNDLKSLLSPSSAAGVSIAPTWTFLAQQGQKPRGKFLLFTSGYLRF